jgi:hypothetical protein
MRRDLGRNLDVPIGAWKRGLKVEADPDVPFVALGRLEESESLRVMVVSICWILFKSFLFEDLTRRDNGWERVSRALGALRLAPWAMTIVYALQSRDKGD